MMEYLLVQNYTIRPSLVKPLISQYLRNMVLPVKPWLVQHQSTIHTNLKIKNYRILLMELVVLASPTDMASFMRNSPRSSPFPLEIPIYEAMKDKGY